jgi:hypothetical protein
MQVDYFQLSEAFKLDKADRTGDYFADVLYKTNPELTNYQGEQVNVYMTFTELSALLSISTDTIEPYPDSLILSIW